MTIKTLGSEFPKEQERLTELLKEYEDIGIAGTLASYMIKRLLKRSYEVAIKNDITEMLVVLGEMQECK